MCKLCLSSVGVGIFLFFVESSVVFVFQGFLRAINLVAPDKLLLPDWYPKSLWAAVALLMIFGTLRSVGYLMKTYLGGVISQSFLRIQRERILQYALENAGQLNSHEVVNMYMERIYQAAQLVNLGAQLGLTCTTAFLFLILGFRLAPAEMAMGVFLLGLFLLPMRALNARILRAGAGIALESEIANRSLIQGLRHYFFLRIYDLIPSEVQRGVESIRNYEEHYRRYFLTFSVKNTLPMAAGIFVISVITYVSVRFLHTPAVGLISFFYIFMRLAQSASESSGTLAEFRLQIPGLLILRSWYDKTIFSDKKVETIEPFDQKLAESFLATIEKQGIVLEVRELSFSYEKTKPVLQNLSLQVSRGDVLVIQGESGVGKSTLLSLILGLYKPNKGEILVNGFSVEKIRNVLSTYIGYVGPEPYLISGSVRENLLYGHLSKAAVQDGEIWLALQKAQLSKEIESLPEQLKTILHAHTQLSTGQRQRMAIARAILRNPKILILDEASANLDGVTEQNFINGLKEILPGLTTIVISHKSSFNGIATQRIELTKS